MQNEQDSEDKRKRHFMNALSNYMPVLGIGNEICEKYGGKDKGRVFPVGWTDPLDLCGAYREVLEKHGVNLEMARKMLLETVMKQGAKHVWEYRVKNVAELIFIHKF
jgi:hypothetical protein